LNIALFTRILAIAAGTLSTTIHIYIYSEDCKPLTFKRTESGGHDSSKVAKNWEKILNAQTGWHVGCVPKEARKIDQRVKLYYCDGRLCLSDELLLNEQRLARDEKCSEEW